MALDVNSIKQTAINVGNSAVKKATELGEDSRAFISRTGKAISDKVDTFEFTKKVKEKGVNKDTLVGMGVFLVGVVLAAKCLKGVIGKIAEIAKKQK